eukprot:CAMPEP_0203943576 /NCGR_PEP_ID=MMETSP0359-20131031/79524_1 /ASSEMBLY_ACC=CAM_ASM_000338 /TAXON_ID=268821 /ORGANISM="Scrippsiella Hangoei, Strain SHTV-5" /LENGTH=53 /DNA_ID=CAMNT_0050874477 /DNA_START=54 /DNA_END=212 /DNA_ORIENTATION=-
MEGGGGGAAKEEKKVVEEEEEEDVDFASSVEPAWRRTAPGAPTPHRRRDPALA